MTGAPDKAIDFDRLRALNSLREWIELYAGQPQRSGRWVCPIHPGADGLNFGLEPDGKHARCWSCGWRGDIIELVAVCEGITITEAAARLDPSARATRAPKKTRKAEPKTTALPKPEPWQDDAWQREVRRIVADCQARLWSREGRKALAWLRARGLLDATIRRFRLGWNPRGFRTGALEVLAAAPKGQPHGAYVARGITIPWLAPETDHDTPTWVAVNVRRLADDFTDPEKPKCMTINGSRRGYLYPYPGLEPHQATMPALLVEGEFDALVGFQEAGSLVHSLTIGGASQAPRPWALAALERLPLWLVATDVDAAGTEAAWAWRDRNPWKARRSLLPFGKDLSAFHLAGGNVRKWVRTKLEGQKWWIG